MEITFAGKFDKGARREVVGCERLTVHSGFFHYLHDSYYPRFFAVAIIIINNLAPENHGFFPVFGINK